MYKRNAIHSSPPPPPPHPPFPFHGEVVFLIHFALLRLGIEIRHLIITGGGQILENGLTIWIDFMPDLGRLNVISVVELS